MTTTLLALIVGLGSGLAGTMLKVSYDRGAELRAHMLAAADGFATTVIATHQRMRVVAGDVLKEPREPLVDPESGWYTKAFKDQLDVVNDLLDQSIGTRSRVHLLFGDLSEAGIASTATQAALRNMDSALNHRPDSLRDHETMTQYSRNFERVIESQEAFSRAALLALRDTGPRRAWRAVRRRTSRAARSIRRST